LLIFLFFLTSCSKQDNVEIETDDREHYKKAKEYYNSCLDGDLELCQKTLGELEIAMFETSGESREDVMDMIKACNDKVELIREGLYPRARETGISPQSDTKSSHKSSWSSEEMEAAGMEGIGSTQNKAISDSKAEIRRKRRTVGAN
jgi:hypothetical protein